MFIVKVEVDVFSERLSVAQLKQNEKEAAVQAAEAEFNRLNRRVQELEEDLENTETKCQTAIVKLDKAATTADDSDRMSKVLQNRASDDEKKMQTLAEQLKEAQKMAEDADKKYDDASKQMHTCEAALEVSDERASVGEFKIVELEEELKVVANNLKSLEVSEDKANQREEYYKEEIKRVTAKLKQSETRAEFAERSVQKLQKEVGTFHFSAKQLENRNVLLIDSYPPPSPVTELNSLFTFTLVAQARHVILSLFTICIICLHIN